MSFPVLSEFDAPKWSCPYGAEFLHDSMSSAWTFLMKHVSLQNCPEVTVWIQPSLADKRNGDLGTFLVAALSIHCQ